MFRDQGIYQTLKLNKLLKNTLLVEIGSFPSSDFSAKGLFSSSEGSNNNVVNIEDVPFIGAELNFDRIVQNSGKYRSSKQ
jgi:hypothetical protein